MTKCVEKQLNASVNQRLRVHKPSLFPVNTPAEGEESFLVDTKLFPFDPISLSMVLCLVLTVSHTTE